MLNRKKPERRRDREKEREGERRERNWRDGERHHILEIARNFISGFEGSQAVSVRRSDRSNAFDRN
jgi:hypothetical protein